MRNKSFIIILTMLLVVNAFSVSFAKPGNGKGKGNSAKFKTEFQIYMRLVGLMKPYQI